MKTLILILRLLTIQSDNECTHDIKVNEAESIVELYQIKVEDAKVQHKKNVLWSHHTAKELHRMRRATIAITQAEIDDAEFESENAKLNCEASLIEIRRSEAELKVMQFKLERIRAKDYLPTQLD